MSNYAIILPDTDLASRKSAAEVRCYIEEQVIEMGNKIFVDCHNVLSMSESYADELFGMLVATHDIKWFTTNIQLINYSPEVMHSIATAIQRRNQIDKTIIDELIMEKERDRSIF